MTTAVTSVEVPPADRPALEALLAELAARYGTADHPEFLRRAGTLGAQLPPDLLDALRDLRQLESAAALAIRGGPVPQVAAPTPAHWSHRLPGTSVPHDFWLALVCAQLGEAIGWSTLQNGSVFNDIVPVAGYEDAQTGQGSTAELEFHVEDAFDDDRCDYLGLLALRNPDGVATTVTSVADVVLGADDEVLFEPRYLIRADPEHVRNAVGPGVAPRARPLLFGARDAPYLRVDPAYTTVTPGDTQAAVALRSLCERLAATAVSVVLAPGDLLVVDNYRAVHGRWPFRPRYDGTDRWLRKLTVTRDLRRSRARRTAPGDRVIAVR